MDLDSKRKQIRKVHFSTAGMITISFLGIVGLLLIYTSGIFDAIKSNILYACISENGFFIIIGLFFFIISIICWIAFFVNIILPPKKEILYLNEVDHGIGSFINEKGKKYSYNINQENLIEKSYYYVTKTRDYIYEVLEKTNDSWVPKEKRSYWLNFYSPLGNFENLLILPIAYVLLLIGLLSFLMANGYDKIYGIIFSFVPIYAIIYDLIYKIKLKKSNGEEIDETNFLKSYYILQLSLSVLVTIIVFVIIIYVFIKLEGYKAKLIFLPFLIAGICGLGLLITKMFSFKQLEKVLHKIYIIVFLIYWFGFLSFWIVVAVKQKGSYMPIFITIPFWISGFLVIHKYFIKKQ